MTNDDLPDAQDIIAAHDVIEEEYDLKYRGAAVVGPELELKRILREVDTHDGIYTRAACLLRDVITAHLFEDGNKRTGWAVTNEYLARSGTAPAVTGAPVERVLKRIRRFDVDELAEWLETGAIDEDRLHP